MGHPAEATESVPARLGVRRLKVLDPDGGCSDPCGPLWWTSPDRFVGLVDLEVAILADDKVPMGHLARHVHPVQRLHRWPTPSRGWSTSGRCPSLMRKAIWWGFSWTSTRSAGSRAIIERGQRCPGPGRRKRRSSSPTQVLGVG